MRTKATKIILVFLIAVMSGLWVVGQSRGQAPEVDTILLGVLPIFAHMPAFAADKLGYFEDEGLKGELKRIESGAVGMALVEAGKLHFVGAEVVSVLQGISRGFDFMLTVPTDAVSSKPPTISALTVKRDSPIKRAKDLEGKSIATNALNNSVWLWAREWARKNGADITKIHFREIPFPQMTDALLNNMVDAAHVVEPFVTVAMATGKVRILSYPILDIRPGMKYAFWTGSRRWIERHPVAARKFVMALRRAQDYLNRNALENRRFMVEYTRIKPELVDQVMKAIAPWSGTVDERDLEAIIDIMIKHGLLKEKLDVAKIIYKG